MKGFDISIVCNDDLGIDVSYAGTPSSFSKSPLQKKPGSRIINVEAPIREPVNENHPVVIELLSADYTLEESIDAVERCEKYGHDMTLDTVKTLGSALDYLAQLDGEGDLLPSTERHLSREDSQTLEDFNMEWYHIHYCFYCYHCWYQHHYYY